MPNKVINFEDDYISAGEGSDEDLNVNNVNLTANNIETNQINKTEDIINNTNESVLKEKLDKLNITEVCDLKQYTNYENLYLLYVLFGELSNLLEIKNYEYNRCVEKWFELTTNKEIYLIEVRKNNFNTT